jgi:Flp pilus assembly protein TadD
VFLMAAAHAQAGDLVEAERLFNEGALFPGMRGDALANLGAVALQRGEPRQALWFLGRAAKLRPEKAGVRYNHALALHRVGSAALALGELRAAEALDPTDSGVHFLAGVVALRLGLADEAAASFRTAVTLDPKFADARHNLALLEGMGVGSESSLSFAESDPRIPVRAAPPARKPLSRPPVPAAPDAR